VLSLADQPYGMLFNGESFVAADRDMVRVVQRESGVCSERGRLRQCTHGPYGCTKASGKKRNAAKICSKFGILFLPGDHSAPTPSSALPTCDTHRGRASQHRPLAGTRCAVVSGDRAAAGDARLVGARRHVGRA
jgi:hypothetical protein